MGLSREYVEQKLREIEAIRHEIRVGIADGSIHAMDGKALLDLADEKERRLTVRFRIQIAEFFDGKKQAQAESRKEFKLSHQVHMAKKLEERRQKGKPHDSAMGI